MADVNEPAADDSGARITSPVTSSAPGAPVEIESSAPMTDVTLQTHRKPDVDLEATLNTRLSVDHSDVSPARKSSSSFSDTYVSRSRDRVPSGYSSARLSGGSRTPKYQSDYASRRQYDSRTQSAYTSPYSASSVSGYDPDYTSRLLAAASGGSANYASSASSTVLRSDNVMDNVRFHPIIDKNRPEAPVNKKLSTRSRQVMMQGYEMGFTSPALKALYDVRGIVGVTM